MNNIYTKIALCFAGIITMLLISEPITAQHCDNLTISLLPTNSTCIANGKIKVNISGSDLVNITQDSVEFQVTGTEMRAFSKYVDNTIENLPAGTYTIGLRVFCKLIDDWVVASTTAVTTLTTSYTELAISIGTPRLSLNCIPTGMIPVNVVSGTGSAPYTIKIIDHPVSYTGDTIFTTSSTNYELDNLNDGNYTISVTDDCGYQIIRTESVGLMPQDYLTDLFLCLFFQRTYTTI